jgi:signal peptidase I
MVTPILSGSMRPGLSVGGVSISERVPVDRLAVRDVIVFQRPDKPSEQVVHRIVQLVVGSSGQVQINTQGDANAVRDPWGLTKRGDSAYRVRWSLPLIGYDAVAFQNHHGFALFGAGIALIVIAVTMVSGSRRRSRRRDEGDGASTGQGDPGPGAPAQAMRIRQATPMRSAVARQLSTGRSPIMTMKNDPCLSRVGCPA